MFRKTRERSPYYHAAIDFGYTLLAAVGVFGWIGWKIDERYGTLPLFLIGGIFLGLAVGFNGLFKRLGRLESADKARDREKRSPSGPKPKP